MRAALEARAHRDIGEDASPLDYVLAHLADGGLIKTLAESLASELGESVSRGILSTLVHHLSPDAPARIHEARRVGADALVEQAMAMADDVPPDEMALFRAESAISTRLWLAAKADPLKYGRRKPVREVGDLHLEALRQSSPPPGRG